MIFYHPRLWWGFILGVAFRIYYASRRAWCIVRHGAHDWIEPELDVTNVRRFCARSCSACEWNKPYEWKHWP